MEWIGDPWTIAGAVLVLGFLVWGVRAIQARMAEQRYQEELAELEFEQSLLMELPTLASASSDNRFIVHDNVERTAPEIDSRFAGQQIISDAVSSAKNDTTSPDLLKRLQTGGLVKNIDGYIELHGDPKGVTIVTLRNNKTALLVPHMESAAFLSRNARRADMIIMCASDGEAYVLRRVEELIADLV